MLEELLVWAKLAELYRTTAVAGRASPSYQPVVAAPRADARRVLGQWLVRHRAAARAVRAA